MILGVVDDAFYSLILSRSGHVVAINDTPTVAILPPDNMVSWVEDKLYRTR
ncbi:MAG: hypothetical protein Ct9H300mP9_5120 [Candidatus Neomarinimicrobiota bacterium]|nr:MAG: hypothetical protein Ct9H300mP9_5120 [Candidatus Neomarinimicrobiota bacterium]